MAVRSDISVDWTASPRVVTVLAPSTSLSIQDLVDTCRFLEMDPVWFAEDHLIDASGRDQIDVGVYVGITACLRNAVVSFEARTGPAWALCKIVGGNLVAKDSMGVYIDPRLHMAFTSIDVEKSTSAALLAGSGGATPAEVAAAVWDEPAAGHATPGTSGRLLADVGNTVSDIDASVGVVDGKVDAVGATADAIDVTVLDVADLVDDLHDEAFGRWVLNPAAATLTLYRKNGAVMQVFNLKVAAADVPAFVERTPT